jgi:hypothetical protein
MRRSLASLFLAFGLVAGVAQAADDKPSAIPTANEMPFVSKVTADLQARFPTPESARMAGYVRYTDEDNSGSISYANRHWTSIDEAHPSQLWYDVNGRLLGADFSVLQADSAAAPQKFGVDPRRWTKFGAHVHFGLAGPNGTTKYGGAGPKLYANANMAGANFMRPDPEDFVKAGIAKSVKDVRFVFLFPAIWDLQVWVLPNVNGAFAEMNPDVKVVKGGGMS